MSLIQRIVDKFGTIEHFCKIARISNINKTVFTLRDIVKWCTLLDIPESEVSLFFDFPLKCAGSIDTSPTSFCDPRADLCISQL